VSDLLLIRHSQASFGAADYDVLSELGIQQSQLLGKYLASTRTKLDAVYTGPRKRQIETAKLMMDAAREGGGSVPEDVTTVEELDEYPWEVVFRQGDMTTPGGFADSLGRWARGEIESIGSTSYKAFVTRVREGLVRIMTFQGRGRTVAAVTSAGPITMSLQYALELRDTVALKLAWNIANSSITRFKYREGELSLVSYNSTPHLTWPEMVTRR
jgi:broad specificity phosphatase PhoE